MRPLVTGPLTVETITVEIDGLSAHLHGCKIVQLSDLHFDGLRLSERLLTEAIALSNDLNPDLVVLTGDYVTDDPTPIHSLVWHLQHLHSRSGILAVLGNHDNQVLGDRLEIMAAFKSVGIQVLWNEIAYPLGSGLAVVGLADFWSKEFDPSTLMPQIEDKVPRLVLSHNPDSAVRLLPWRVDLQLSGHTHGGQFVIPGIGAVPTWYQTIRRFVPQPVRPWVPYMREDCYKVVRHWEWAQGFHRVGKNQLYVNRGLGTYWPGRFFCPPELTVITLTAKPTQLTPMSMREQVSSGELLKTGL